MTRLALAGIPLAAAGSIFTLRLFVALLLAAALGWWMRGSAEGKTR